MGIHRKGICLEDIALGIDNRSLGNLGAVTRFDNNFLAQTRLLVGINSVGDILHKVFIVELAADLAHDNGVEGVPFANNVAVLNGIAILEIELRTVRDICRGKHHLCLWIDDTHFCQTADNNLYRFAVDSLFFSLDCAEFVKFENTFVTRCNGGNGSDIRSHTTDVERTEGKLGSRFANRLSRDYTHSLAHLDRTVGCKVTAIALGADAML